MATHLDPIDDTQRHAPSKNVIAECVFWVMMLLAVCLARPAFAQYGTLDTSWGSSGNGYVRTNIVSGTTLSATDRAGAVAFQLDGKIVVAGHCYDGSIYQACVARYLTNGALDSSFNGSGTVTFNLGGVEPNTRATGLAITAYGQVLVAQPCRVSASNTQMCVVRFTKDGALDTTFASNGKLTTALTTTSNAPSALAHQNDGRLLIGGLCGSQLCVLRYFENGELIDTGFGSNGVATNLATGTFNRETYTMQVDAADRVFLAGSCFVNSQTTFCVSRFTSNGAADTSFGNLGIVTADAVPGGADYGYAMALQPDGKVLLAGQAFNTVNNVTRFDYAVVRYNDDGAVDTNFGNNGVATTRVADTFSEPRGVVVMSDGRIVVGGWCEDFSPGGRRYCMTAYTSSGALDASFNGSGILKTALTPNINQEAYALGLGRDGKLYLAGGCRYPSGSSQYSVCVLRVNGAPNVGRRCVVDFGGSTAVRATEDSLALSRIVRGVWNQNPNAVLSAFTNVIFSASQVWTPFNRWMRGGFDYDGDGQETPTDALLHARAALGFSGDALTAGISFAPGATRSSASAIRNYFVNQCGLPLP